MPETVTPDVDSGSELSGDDLSRMLEVMAEPPTEGQDGPSQESTETPAETPAEGVSENTDEAIKPAEDVEIVFAPEQEAELKAAEPAKPAEPPQPPAPPEPPKSEAPKFELTPEEREKLEDGDVETILAVQRRQGEQIAAQVRNDMMKEVIRREQEQFNAGIVDMFERNKDFESIPTETLNRVGAHIGAKYAAQGPHKVIMETEKFLRTALDNTAKVKAAAGKATPPKTTGTGAVAQVGHQAKAEQTEDPTIGILKRMAEME